MDPIMLTSPWIIPPSLGTQGAQYGADRLSRHCVKTPPPHQVSRLKMILANDALLRSGCLV